MVDIEVLLDRSIQYLCNEMLFDGSGNHLFIEICVRCLQFVASVLSCRNRLLVKTELKTPFCAVSHASPTGFFRFQITDSNLEIFDKNENFQTPVAALDRNTKSK